MIDVKQQISAVRRKVGTRVLDAGTARVSVIGQTYDTDLEDLWDAVTNPERIPRWFLPISGDLRLAGITSSRAMRAARWSAASARPASPPPGSSAAW